MPDGTDPDGYGHEAARERMVERLRERGAVGEVAGAALSAVPRHEFVPADRREHAYEDRPLPIGSGQTISAPHVVGRMVEALGVGADDRVLEVGTGCGYHAAVTAAVVGPENVFSVEYHEELAERARETLARTGFGGVSTWVGDGHEGWPEHAPYDAAYLTCAAPEFPAAVVEQVHPGGTVLGPLGERRQHLVRGLRRPDGGLDREQLAAVRFVRMQGGDG